ncbi:MAG TPA: glycosyltransferase [Casimicrobiaceae bacterium]|nr:glycosyltransferase [Casimicrobiaceae bacterium]
MRLSVVLPVFNGASFLAAAVDSVLAQTRSADEVIAVDDGSTDDSRAILARYPAVRVVSQANAGCAAARNAGAALASGDAIAFVDQDDIQCVERFARQIDALRADSRLGFVVCSQQNFLSETMVRPPPWCDPRTLAGPQHGFGANTLLLRREVFSRVGVFDPGKVPMDDSDWLLRALDGGERYLHLDAALVRRRIHDANLSARRYTPLGTHLMARTLHESLQRRRGRGETR